MINNALTIKHTLAVASFERGRRQCCECIYGLREFILWRKRGDEEDDRALQHRHEESWLLFSSLLSSSEGNGEF